MSPLLSQQEEMIIYVKTGTACGQMPELLNGGRVRVNKHYHVMLFSILAV